MSQTQHPQAHTAHGSGVPTPGPGGTQPVHPSGAQKGAGDALRQAVAAQPTVMASVAALLAGVCGMIEEALQKADPGSLKGLADSISSDLMGWVAAVPANTPSAVLSAGSFGVVPTDVQKAFDAFAQQQAQHATGGAPAAH